MFAILRKEFNAFLNSPVAYVVLGVFLVAIGLFVWVFPDSSVLDYGFADLQTLFNLAPWIFLFLIPALTMRTFAEEKKAGTIELLLTRPLTDGQLVGGKYLACLLLALLALVPTLLYYYSVYQLGSPQGNIDSAAFAGSLLGLALLAAVFAAIGVLASALTRDQIIAFLVAVVGCFLVYSGFDSLASLFDGGPAYYIGQLGIAAHYRDLSKGLVDSRDVLYFFSVVAAMLLATRLVLQSRNW
ncbi:gliding motility-associated ABC transporter permease subunit GldF [Hymenobacter busanensis]|uniref:Gliding motility-associated ABC transporter permease subunit GldF n=1 Tax=Hymenobacter busanensis TaxID=2607656 RepID=A0A7L4ZTT3_9BACT|nr:gliding motility-associated ABC transporter permease subunit GldF [Hymenobacter busanensis]KAA9339421.1 gliding motility-associated ABC transporter permease subunit GldF [Hymenobacter busanensis]QHJ06819.1 gliding motility-associated ABC transporter permease subunit GldF [Hymenobacter busanensis]